MMNGIYTIEELWRLEPKVRCFGLRINLELRGPMRQFVRLLRAAYALIRHARRMFETQAAPTAVALFPIRIERHRILRLYECRRCSRRCLTRHCLTLDQCDS